MQPSSLVSDVAFQCAFAAVSYFTGTRDAAALAPFQEVRSRARALLAQLSDADRSARAVALARELEELARELERRQLR